MPPNPKPAIIILLADGKIKKRGILPVTRPTNRGLRIAHTVERATSKPTPICIHFSLYGYKTHRLDAISHTSKGMRNISHPEGIYRCYAQDCVRSLRSSDSSRTKRQVNAFILCRDTFIPLTFSPILAQESRLKRLQMPRHGVSECSIGCKDNEKNDYSRIFS